MKNILIICNRAFGTFLFVFLMMYTAIIGIMGAAQAVEDLS